MITARASSLRRQRARSVGVVIVLADGAEGAADVAMMRVIQDGLSGLSPSGRPACEPSPAPIRTSHRR